MPTEEHNPARPHQGVSQSVLALMPPLKILAPTLGAALLACGLLFAYVSSPANADTTFVVNSTGDENDLDFPGGTFDGSSDAKCDVDSTLADDQCTLRAAIQEANVTAGDDAIDIEVTGTVNLTAELPDLSSNIEIVGPGANQFTVRRADTAEPFRILTVTGDTTVVTISGMTISKGNSLGVDDLGGGISNENNGTLTITDSIISGNTGSRGGGIRNFGTLTITDSTISGNSATADGGAIRNDGTLEVSNSTLSDNTSNNSAGAIHNVGVLKVSNSTFSDNIASGGGEGAAIFNQCTLEGGICIERTGTRTGTVTVTDSTFSGNSAGDRGGAIGNTSCCTVTVTDSTFSGNSAGNRGGAISNQRTLTVTNSTFSGNSAGAGGGIFNNSGAPTLKNTIVANSPSGGDCFARPTDPITDAGYNLVEDGSCLTAATSLSGDPMLGDLADNGGPTMTHALLSDSPAIDAGPPTNGDPTACPPPDTDQRGVSRPQGSTCDIGSFELEKPDTEAPKVESTVPRDGGEVGPAANIRATFSEEMLASSINGTTFKLFRKGTTNKIAAAVTYDAETHIATLNPTNNLRRGVTYKAVVSTLAKDVAGNGLDQDDSRGGLQRKVWFFEIDN
jgi:CSLREA domain-containing protein